MQPDPLDAAHGDDLWRAAEARLRGGGTLHPRHLARLTASSQVRDLATTHAKYPNAVQAAQQHSGRAFKSNQVMRHNRTDDSQVVQRGLPPIELRELLGPLTVAASRWADRRVTESCEAPAMVAQRLMEANKFKNIDAAYRKLSAQPDWSEEGWRRSDIIDEIDPHFIHHAEHVHRLLYGGVRPDGTKFPGGGGLEWSRLDVRGKQAVLVTHGSFEYFPEQTDYTQKVAFANYGRIVKAEGLTWPEKAQMLLTRDNLRIHCTCPAYHFYHQYAATEKGFALKAEGEPADTNNPQNLSGACKHLNIVLRWLGAQGSKLASEMKAKHEK